MSNRTGNTVPEKTNISYGLKDRVLSSWEVISQSVANIAPTATPALVIPLVFAVAGGATWVAYIFATIATLLVALSINVFAKRSASPGSFYTYIADSLGPIWGTIIGWILFISYIGVGSAVTTGFTNYINVLIKDIFGLTSDLPTPVLTIILGLSILGTWFIAYKDIRLSTRLMMGLELTSIAFISVVVVATVVRHGFHLDWSQLSFSGVTADNLRLGLVLAIFSFVGFESATALGSEAKSPLTTIPQAVWRSALFVGLLFAISAYAEVLGFAGNAVTLDKSDAPLQVLAANAGIPFFGVLITIGAVFSFFACTLASITAGSRVLFLLARHGVFHSLLGGAHDKNETPHVAVTLSAIIAFIPAALLTWNGQNLFAIYGWIGTTATLGFIVVYIVTSIAAPVYLYRRKELRVSNILVAAAAVILQVVALVGAVYPLPAAPNNYPIYAFVVLLAIGLIIGFVLQFRPGVYLNIQNDLVAIEKRHHITAAED